MLQSTLKLAAVIIAVALAASVFGEKVTQDAGRVPSDPASVQGGAGSLQVQVSRPASSGGPSGYSGSGERLIANAQGHFSAAVEVDGVTVPTLVDTGATLVAFSAEDAERAGLRPLPSEYRHRTSTANGEVAVAIVKVRDLRLGSITLHDVDAAVLPAGALRQSLLGMSFLKRLALFQVEGDTLVLRQ